LVIILGGWKTNAIERKMMERVEYFSSIFSVSPGIVLMSAGYLVERVEVLFDSGMYLFFSGTSGGSSGLWYVALGNSE
jgi:hypothetical protein